MKTGKLKAQANNPRLHDSGLAPPPLINVGRRARLLGASALAGGAIRGLAIAAGMATGVGASPALAPCFSGAAGGLDTAACEHTAAAGGSLTAGGVAPEAPG